GRDAADLEYPLRRVAEHIGQQADRQRPRDPAERVPEQEHRPPHVVDAGQPGRRDPQPRDPAPEKDRLRPVTLEERLAPRDDLPPLSLERARALEQPAPAMPADQVADVV